jgi:chaperonin cofactor prefoldin
MIDWHTKEVDRSVCGDATTVYGQSLLTQIKTLQSENESLKSRVTSLETQLQSILTRLTNANI